MKNVKYEKYEKNYEIKKHEKYEIWKTYNEFVFFYICVITS